MVPRRTLYLLAAFTLVIAACGDDAPPQSTYYERNIQPILTQFCAGNTAGCHSTNTTDEYAFAAGNLDVTSFENINKRRDLLRSFGPFTVPLLLVKGVASNDLGFVYDGEFVPLEVQHSGGAVFRTTGDAYITLLTWMNAGATENGLPPPERPEEGGGPCGTVLPVGFDPAIYTGNASFAEFKANVQPVLNTCNSGNCHGTPAADLYLTCGTTDDQVAFNFSRMWSFVDDPVDNSQVLQVPLSVSSGGWFHSGGDHFSSRSDASYVAIRTWAETVGKLTFGEGDPAKEFFAANVQPILLKRGCSFEACHSPNSTNDFKLRSGSQGFFSAVALERNYELLKKEFLAFEVPDVRRGRAVSKTVFPEFGGIPHRGGPVMRAPGSGASTPASCTTPYDPLTASAYCTFQEWLNIERAALISTGDVLPLGNGDSVPLVYVDRQESHVASLLEFDTYQPNSDLMAASATIGADGALTGVTNTISLLDNCAGAGDRTIVDVRNPDISPDGTRVAFAMRTSAAAPLSLYLVDLNGLNCTVLTPPAADVSGMRIHNFDPAWSPDGEWIVFASTRGISGTPAVSRKHFLPQSDIWRMRVDGSNVEAMTYLTNSEISPQWMREGRIIMTTEKVSGGFYQLAGRRINWDRTDYHPLLGQRANSPLGDISNPDAMLPSVGYSQTTEIREAFNGDFLVILSDEGARAGAGTLATFNRSVGPMEVGRTDAGYMPSMEILDPAATGRVGGATNGAYRSPFPLLDGRTMVSYSTFSGDLGTASSFDWDIVMINHRTGARTTLVGGPGAQVEAVLGLKYPERNFFNNRRQLVFGGAVDPAITGGDQYAVIHFPDAPLIFTLLNANLRRGRPASLYDEATQLAIYVENFAPPGTTSGSGQDGIFESRTLIGRTNLASDGSARIRTLAGVGVILELQDANNNPVVTMKEEHQVGPGEFISLGIKRDLFDPVCGGCHGSVSGSELDVFVTADALTGASASASANATPVDLLP